MAELSVPDHSNMADQLRYRFIAVTNCNMCGTPVKGNRILGRRLNRPQGRNPRKVIGVSTTVVRCRSCGLIYSDPQPVPFDLQDHYGVPPESYWKPEYFTVNPGVPVGAWVKAKELLDFTPGMRALDIGAGIGKAMRAMEHAGFEVHGFEPSVSFHERGLKQMGMDADRYKLGMVEEMEYPEDHFDLVSFSVVLEHIYDPSAAVVRAMRWLKPGGVMHIEVPSSDWLVHRMVNTYYRLRGTDHVANLSPMHEPYHLFEFTRSAFERHAQQHGYSVAEHQYFVCKTFLPTFLDPILKPFMRLTDTGMILSIWLRK